MIVASPKSITELKNLIAGHEKVLFVGCGTCVTVCLAGGEREVGIASYAIRMARKLEGEPLELTQVTIERQCENEFIKDLAEPRPSGRRHRLVRLRRGRAGHRRAVPRQAGLRRPEHRSSWASSKSRPSGPRSAWAAATACWPQFGGICPVTRCAKRLLNGPCGGSTETHCEVDPDRPCAWQLIYTRLKNIGQLDRLEEIVPPKDWSTSWHAGARKVVRKEHRV